MKIQQDAVVRFNYVLTNDAGQVLDQSPKGQPMAYLHGHGNLIPGLESRVEGRGAGESLTVKVPAAEAYGLRDDGKIIQASRAQFPAEVEVKTGMQFHANSPQGAQVVTVVAVDGERVTLDANHQLAGVDLTFAVEVVEVRAATADELDHGHVHGAGGCGHGH